MKTTIWAAAATVGLLALTGCGLTQTAPANQSATDTAPVSAAATTEISASPTPMDPKSIAVTDIDSLLERFEAAGGVCKNPHTTQMSWDAIPLDGLTCENETPLYIFDDSPLAVDKWCGSVNLLANLVKEPYHVAYQENWAVQSPQVPEIATMMGGTTETYPL